MPAIGKYVKVKKQLTVVLSGIIGGLLMLNGTRTFTT